MICFPWLRRQRRLLLCRGQNTNTKTNANAIASANDAANKASSEMLDTVVKYPTDMHYGSPRGFPTDGVRGGNAGREGTKDDKHKCLGELASDLAWDYMKLIN